MNASTTRRTSVSIITAAFLSLLLASQAVAATWSQPIALTNSGGAKAGTQGLVTLGSTHAIAAYWNKGRIFVRRSTDSGATWLAPQRLAKNASGSYEAMPSIAGRGTDVDVVWIKNGRIRYARSTNSGASFRPTVALSPESRAVMAPKVGRGANGLVVVAWMQVKRTPCCNGPWEIHARVSTNGGASFGSATVVGRGYVPVVAAGNGVAYVAHSELYDEYGLQVRRTIDGGKTWAPPTLLTAEWRGDYPGRLSMTAAGKQAYIAYVSDSWGGDDDEECYCWIQYRRTTDKGASWSAARNITSPGSQCDTDPVISLKGGLVQVIFGRAGDIWYRQSSNGLSWTPQEQVTAAGQPGWGGPAGVGHATKPIVLYYDDYFGGNVFVRTGNR